MNGGAPPRRFVRRRSKGPALTSAPLVILHAGAPKTGTTALQAHLRRHDAQLRAAGIRFVRRFPNFQDVDPIYRMLRRLRERPGDAELIAAARARLKELAADAPRILISYEDAFGRATANALFSDALPAVARDLAAVFEGCDLHIVTTLRRQSEILRASYVQELRSGSAATLTTFLDVPDFSVFGWRRYLDAIADAFPEAGSTVLHYDVVESRPDELLTAIGKHAGADLGLPPLRERLNRSFPLGGRAAARAVNRAFASLPDGFRRRFLVDRTRRVYLEAFARVLGGVLRPSSEGTLRLEKMEAMYAAENDALSAISGASVREALAALG